MNPNPFDFSGKCVLVTGSGRGIGRGIASSFAAAGAAVGLHYRSNRAETEAMAEEIRRGGGRAAALGADLALPEEVEGLVARAEEDLGGLDILINNAGEYPVAPLLELPPADWRRVVEANLTSAFLVTQAAARGMQRRGSGGVIVNIASIEAQFSAFGHSHYDAAKAGMVALTRSSALELAPYGIRVNTVSPGLIGRKGLEQDWPQGVESWLKLAPLARLG
ncbi:MAG TPA: SDR family NAD(P)-dependent oxidoreductase, partial [Anaerolineales bacterium]